VTEQPARSPLRKFSPREAVSNLSLAYKIALIPAITLLLIGLMLAGVIRVGERQTAALRALDSDVFEPLNRAQTLKDEITLLHTHLFALLSLGTNVADPIVQAASAEALLTQLGAAVTDVARFLEMTSVVPPPTAERLHEVFGAYAIQVRQTAAFAAYDASYGAMLASGTNENFQTLRADLDALVLALAQRRAALTSEIIGNSVKARRRLLGLGVGGALVALLGSILVGRSVSRPILRLTVLMNRLAGGDTDLVVSGTERQNEFGAMARAVEVFRANLVARRLGDIDLRSTHLTLDAALNSMLQGLVVWGPDRTVQIVNGRFYAIHGLPPSSLRPGMTVRETFDTMVRYGLWPDENPDDVCARIAMQQTAQRSTQTERAVRPGLFVREATEPMADGGTVITFDDVTEKRQSQERIAFMADHDALTGLANRTLFQSHMARLEGGGGFAVLCLDLDHFKEVNDTLGHAVGDELLRQVGVRLNHCVRECDMVARLGGDEFAVVMTYTIEPGESAVSLATRLVETVAVPYEVHGHNIVIGTSIGIALSEPGSEAVRVTGAELLKRADVALYRAKEARGTFAVFEPGMEAHLHIRRGLESELRIAVRNGEFELDYQPFYNLVQDRVTGFEALVRWNSPMRGRVAPEEFISISEETGLIVPIGEWVLRTACADAISWPDHVSVAVNVSPAQFGSKQLVTMVREVLEETGLPARRLELEITETVLLKHTDATMTMLRDLHDLGVRISMDDFGTGYSSLSYLGLFPFDKIKIDRSFVADVKVLPRKDESSTPLPERDSAVAKSAAMIVRAIIGLGTNLGISTIAEGVETAEQFARLRAEGCNELQGYFLSPPRPVVEVAALIRRLDTTLPALRSSFVAPSGRKLGQLAAAK
jgi:diguanylate cyclase (GGDEF)-like protein